jgi:two-component system cell cycle response regulator
MHAAVVDPSRVVLKIMMQLLAEQGTVSGFVDSDSALQCIKNDPTVDVLITSLEVQPMSGLELCWETRLAISAERPLYIIVMSSLGDERKLAEALDCGADDLIAKPVKRIELLARLRMAGRLKSAQLDLVRLTETDPLTGLLNRRAFFDRLTKLLKNPDNAVPVSAIMLDIDQFKRINDIYGHQVGDAVIKRIAIEVDKVAGDVGRLGGEEFAIVLKGYDENRAYSLADNLRQSCANIQFIGNGEPFHVTCSFGVSEWSGIDASDDLLKQADVALYQAKASGRNCVQRATAGNAVLLTLPSENIRSQKRYTKSD